MNPLAGTGPTLREASSYLRDDAVRHARILEVTECDSVIEGLPPLSHETRARILVQLKAIAGQRQAPAESPPA